MLLLLQSSTMRMLTHLLALAAAASSCSGAAAAVDAPFYQFRSTRFYHGGAAHVNASVPAAFRAATFPTLPF